MVIAHSILRRNSKAAVNPDELGYRSPNQLPIFSWVIENTEAQSRVIRLEVVLMAMRNRIQKIIQAATWHIWSKTGIAILVGLLLWMTTGMADARSPANQPDWKVGRAVIQSEQGQGRRTLLLKLSLRNKGRPGNVKVRLSARWTRQQKLRPLRSEDMKTFHTLGTYQREVALKQTAILNVSLEALKPRPRNSRLELIIYTGKRRSEHRLLK